MTPPPPRKRGTVRPGAPITPLRKLGEIRRAQAITTYGVGSMIAVDNESFVIAGLDTWDVSRTRTLWEPRLTRVTGAHEFKLPPAVDSEDARDGVRAARFPQLYSCPECRELQYYSKFNPPKDKAVCGACERDLVPSRFVMACVNGHLDDFPYWKWVHRSFSYGPGEAGSVGRCGGKLRLRAEGSTASLRGVVIGCTCGAKEVSMEGAFRSQALRDLGIRCTGRRPWLKDAPAQQCGEPPRTLQRGSSTVWYPVVHSALSIPPWSDGVLKALGPHWNNIQDEAEDEAEIRAYLKVAKFEKKNRGLTVDDAVAAVLRAREAEAEPPAEEHTTLSPRDLLYQEEYRTLQRERPEDGRDELQDFVCEPPSGDRTPDGIGQVMLVKRVREIRVLHSFTRVEEPAVGDTASSSRRAALALRKPDWLPAIEVSGEGVFVRLDPEWLAAWEQRPQPQERAARVRRNHEALLRERYANSDRPVPPSPISPRYLAVHTLAHLLINEWSLDGGYPAASLRERLYIGDDMAGFLIYTATSDSAGSLGGIVAQGEPERLTSSLESALLRASWCSNDPLCSEAAASGADSVNLAACHACVLLPETSCETNNAFLDRVALVGTPDGVVSGLF
ncbi:DrmB family protein [Streptomyces sp. NPDC092296]|uniref:DrmB family protein n=1 Tax=Streptomyces sp. NPDC092296 TaxID=3366012 RepID=UPI00380BF055